MTLAGLDVTHEEHGAKRTTYQTTVDIPSRLLLIPRLALPGSVVTGHLEQNPHYFLRFSAVLRAQRRSAYVEERCFALCRDGFGEHRLTRPRWSVHQNACGNPMHDGPILSERTFQELSWRTVSK